MTDDTMRDLSLETLLADARRQGAEAMRETDNAVGGKDCDTCGGTGRVNPLTAPKGVLCLATMDCPHCDGSGVDV